MDATDINTAETQHDDGTIVSADGMCRICLLDNSLMRDLFSDDEVASLSTKAMSLANVKMLPGDGLPCRICCVCADKLESAYGFKLQVEHADALLRERFLTMNMKEELFFNEVEVAASLTSTMSNDDEDCPSKVGGVTLGPLGRLTDRDERSTIFEEQDNDCSRRSGETINLAGADDDHGDSRGGMGTMTRRDELLRTTSEDGEILCKRKLSERENGEILSSCANEGDDAVGANELGEENRRGREDVSATDEHDYILQETYGISNPRHVGGTRKFSEGKDESSVYFDNADPPSETSRLDVDTSQRSQALPADDTCQTETRKSKRRIQRKFPFSDRNSDEENYFENLNLSSRLKKVQVDKIEKIFFVCYLCDKQFVSKDVLREHMHSHEEVRKTFSFKKTPDKSQKYVDRESPEKMPPSGKKPNKCSYCGKEYLYIISFNKHLRQHEKDRRQSRLAASPSSAISRRDNEHAFVSESGTLESRKRGKRDRDDSAGNEDCDFEPETIDAIGSGNEFESGNEIGYEPDMEGHETDSEMTRKVRQPDDQDDEDDRDADTDAFTGLGIGLGAEFEIPERHDKQRRKRCAVDGVACEKCSERFHSKKDLRKHSITHIALKCSVCESQFDSLEKLRNHRTKHVLEGVLTEQDLEESGKFGEFVEYLDLDRDDRNGSTKVGSVGEDRQDTADDAGDEDEECKIGRGNGHSANVHVDKASESPGSRGAKWPRVSSKYDCKLCCERFTRKDLLQRHAEQHTRAKPYKCTECNKTFGNELTLRNHLIATEHKTFLHGQEYDPNKRLKRVAARAAQRIIDKIKTEDGLEDIDEDEDHNDGADKPDAAVYGRRRETPAAQRRSQNKKDLECASCNKRCSSKQALAKHMEQHVKDEKPDKWENSKKIGLERREYNGTESQEHHEHSGTSIPVAGANGNGNSNSTSTGGATSSTRGTSTGVGQASGHIVDEDDDDSDFGGGLDWPMDSHECATCKKRYSTKKSLLRHQLLHEEPNFECDICNVKFYRKDKLKAHYDKCSEKNPDQVRKCNICGDSFENNEILREHRSKHVTEGILTEEDLRDIEPKPEEKKQGERMGRKRRTDIVGLECTECNKQYTSRKGLLRHIQVHEGKKYLCDICPKKFYRREHLKIHVAKHNMIKPYKCARCTKRFIKEDQLTNHLSKHDRTFKKNKETDSTKRFLCEICSKSFTQSTTLIAHLRAHNGIKPYVCEVCSRPFTTNAYLKMHMRTHTQERPYICQYCSRAFARADTLANHLTSHTGEAKYHCKYCPKNFRRLKSLKEHVFIHTGQRPYACPTCDRRFNNNGSRYAHSKRCKQNFLQNQNRAQAVSAAAGTPGVQPQQQLASVTAAAPSLTAGTPAQIVKAQNIKTITISRQSADAVTAQQVMQHQEILMPLILPLTVTLADVGEEVILPEGTKIFTTT